MLTRLIRGIFGRGAAAPKQPSATYREDYFAAPDMDAAKRIILTGGGGTTTEERWERETPFLTVEIGRELALDANACVLDYGCGIGRLSKALIEAYGCSVVGVDISSNMRELAAQYVDSSRFTALSPQMLDQRVRDGFRATNAFSCWVLQHCEDADAEVQRIHSALRPGGTLFVLNSHYRCLPTDGGWFDDGVSIEALLTSRFERLRQVDMPVAVTTPEIAACAYMLTLRKTPTLQSR